MALAFVSSGAGAAGTTSLAVPFPSPVASGNLLILSVTNKYPSNGPSTPAGWTLRKQVAGGANISAVDSGNVYITVFTKISDGTETGNLTVTLTSANSSLGRIWQYSIDATSTWSIAAAGGANGTAGTAWSVTMDGDPGIVVNDVALAFSSVNTDAYTYSAETLTATGCTFSAATERADAGIANGDDCGAVISEHVCTAGPSSAAAVYAMTASGTLAVTNPAGSTALLRLREIQNYTFTADVTTYALAGIDALTALTMPADAGAYLLEGFAAMVETVAANTGIPSLPPTGRGPRVTIQRGKKPWPWQRKKPPGNLRY